MQQKLVKISELAAELRVSRDAVGLWMAQGIIPPDCILRIARTVRIDRQKLEQRIRAGALAYPRSRAAGITL